MFYSVQESCNHRIGNIQSLFSFVFVIVGQQREESPNTGSSDGSSAGKREPEAPTVSPSDFPLLNKHACIFP